MRRVTCVYLPNWPLQRLRHERPERPELRDRPLVLTDTHSGRGWHGRIARGAETVLLASAEAVRRWQSVGADVAKLATANIQISNLGGGTLGLATIGGNTMRLDDNAAGHGWFVDQTPWDDSESSLAGDQGEEGRMDLLTTVLHEMGHILGLEDVYDLGARDEWMFGFLETGERRTPLASAESAAVDAVFSGPSVPGGGTWNPMPAMRSSRS